MRAINLIQHIPFYALENHMKLSSNNSKVCRRLFLKTAFILGISACCPGISLASVRRDDDERRLNLYNPKTKECFDAAYWIKGNYVKEALSDINSIMRDLHTGEVKEIDTELLDLLFGIQQEIDAIEPFHIMSGYRSPYTNEILRKKGWAVSKHSLHLKGKAIDIRLPKTKTSLLRRTAYRLKKGGVGYYPKLKFVHVDIGALRYWTKY